LPRELREYCKLYMHRRSTLRARSAFPVKCAAMIALFVLSISASVRAQSHPPAVVEITDEPHHVLVLSNERVRVFRLKLAPHEVTLPHRHQNFYAYVSLLPATIGNEVHGRQPVITQLDAGDLHTSKGGFNLAERNESSELAVVIVIEVLKSNGAGFSAPMKSFHYHEAAFGELFETSAARGYVMTVAAGGRIEEHTENYDRLLIAVSDLHLRETSAGQDASELIMKAGDVRWAVRGSTHAVTNVGTVPATFITLELN